MISAAFEKFDRSPQNSFVSILYGNDQLVSHKSAILSVLQSLTLSVGISIGNHSIIVFIS